jgi:hypothetical protein
VISSLDPAIRSEAFAILRPYVEGAASEHASSENGGVAQQDTDERQQRGSEPAAADTSNAETFVRSQALDKPVDAARAIAAWWFSQYGTAPITAPDIRKVADQIGVTIPARPDRSIEAWKTAEGKDVYRSGGRGKHVPTVPHGELYFQSEYNVTKGTLPPPSANDA